MNGDIGFPIDELLFVSPYTCTYSLWIQSIKHVFSGYFVRIDHYAILCIGMRPCHRAKVEIGHAYYYRLFCRSNITVHATVRLTSKSSNSMSLARYTTLSLCLTYLSRNVFFIVTREGYVLSWEDLGGRGTLRLHTLELRASILARAASISIPISSGSTT